jgi:hypothetical protein
MRRTAGAALCVFLWASVAVADEAFILNIPQRFDASQETGEVRVTLHLAAAPAAAQLIVNNSATLALGQTQTVSGDSVSFAAGEGNSVRIIYQPLSNFSGSFCAGAGATEKNVPLRFVGPNVTKYNITSYVVGAPAAECSKVSKRVGESSATLIANDDGVAPALDAEYGGRHPLDVALVLDQSGSISELPPDATGGPTKAVLLRSAMKTLIATWAQMDIAYPEDRMGLVFFSGAATPHTFPGGDAPANFFVRRGSDAPGPSHDWTPLGNGVDGLTPGGSTSIGAGLNAAMQQWTADPDHDLAILIVTDGIQNTAPLIEMTAEGFLTLTPVGGLPAELRKRFVTIRSVGFNVPGAVDGALLTKMALETSGVSYIGIDGSTVMDDLALTLISILKGNTASLALRQHGTAQQIVASTPVPVDASVERAVFSVQWAPPAQRAYTLEVKRPDGTIAKPDSVTTTPQATLFAFDMDDKADLGTWRVRVRPEKDRRPVPYTLHVYFVERHLDFTLSLDPPRPTTGHPVTVRARVAYQGKPLTDLPAGAIKVRVQRPGEGLGNILHGMESGNGGATAAVSGDVRTAYQQKVARLPKGMLGRVVARDVETLTLVHDRNGVYSAPFSGTSVPGQYGFEALLDWDHPRTGHVRREERRETDVRAGVVAARSEIAFSPNVNGTVRVSVTPRDRFGNFLGPGYASVVRAKLASKGRLDPTPVDREQRGTYVFTITGVPRGETPRVEISVDGDVLRFSPTK